MRGLKLYISNVLVAFDSLVNAIFGGAPSETISGRAARAARDNKSWGRWLCKFLNWLEPGHCEQALLNDERGRHKETWNIESRVETTRRNRQ